MNSRGFALTQTMVAVAIIGIATLAWMAQVRVMQNMTARQNNLFLLQQIQGQVKALVADDVSWLNTVNNAGNPALLCLQMNTDCAGQSGAFSLLDKDNKAFVSSANSAGFDLNGNICQTYGEGNCVLKVNLSWNAICPPTGDCDQPLVQIQGDFVTSKGSPFESINLSRFRIQMTRDQNATTSEENLASLGKCPEGTYMQGYDPVGRLLCTTPGDNDGASGDGTGSPANPSPGNSGNADLSSNAPTSSGPKNGCSSTGGDVMCHCAPNPGMLALWSCSLYHPELLTCTTDANGNPVYKCNCSTGYHWIADQY